MPLFRPVPPWLWTALPLLLTFALPRVGAGQEVLPFGDWEIGSLVRLGSVEEDRARLAQLLDGVPSSGFLLRSTADLNDIAGGGDRTQTRLLVPTLETVWNSDLPFSLNDGSLWAGRGTSLRITGGVQARIGRVRLLFAPEIVHERNRPFQTIPFRDPEITRSPFAHPFHSFPESIDQPLRFGDEPRTDVLLGQSRVSVDFDPVVVGVSTENQWWGPGARNAIVLSSHAPGFPHLFAGTAHPIVTPFGAVEAKWILGRLSESDFFDDDQTNDHNSLSAVVVTLSPAFDPDLTLGFARSVFAPLDEDEVGFGAALDAFKSVGRPNSDPEAEPGSGADQVFSLFGRWVFPGAGFEAWGEWARFEQPASLSDFLEMPDHSQGWTIGLQWARAVGPPASPVGEDGESLAGGAPLVRIQAEITNLEPASTFLTRTPFTSYASRVVPQGYTHRGQVLGAAIGPGSSGQWIAVDHLREQWSVGGFFGRIRSDNNIRLTGPVPPPRDEDVALFWGLRGHVDVYGFRAAAELTTGVRLNYLFQSGFGDGRTQERDGMDIANETLSLTLSRAAPW